jgi:acetolactate synthase-1/2/3 large subunit
MSTSTTVQLSTHSNRPDNQSEPRTLSDLIVDYLAQLGVEYVFGVPGGHNSFFYEALARSERKGGPRAILTRHETGAAFMAVGYARETGKIGVCSATTGPGATNLITGVAAAYADHDPLLVITAQTLLSHFGQGAFQESSPDTIDATSMLDHCTRYSTIVTHPDQLEKKLVAALTTALQAPQGPAHISIPVNIFRSPASESIAYPNLAQLLTNSPSYVDLARLETLCQLLYDVLNQGRQIALLIGHDCSGASQEIMAFAELINAPIVTTQAGKSWIDPYHPLARGVFGFAGHETARQALTDESVELILAVGTDLSQWPTSNWDTALLNNKLVHIHPSSAYFTRSPMARLQVHGTINTVFQELLTRIMQRNEKLRLPTTTIPSSSDEKCLPPQIEVKKPENYQRVDSPSSIKPPRLICKLLQQFPPETRFLIDVGNWLAWTIHYFFSTYPENYRLSTRTAAMGWGIGSAVGTALGTPNTPVVCMTGDGSFLMNGQEITVAVAEQLPVIFIILNDQSYGMVKHRHRQTGTESLEFAIPPVDFSLMAKAVGAKGYSIRNAKDFEQLDLQEIYTNLGPTVLDVHIDPEEVPPLGMF